MWVSTDIAKGGRERWVPVIADLEPVVAEIRADVQTDEYVLPAQRFRDPPFNADRRDLRHQPSSSQSLRQLVMRVAERAGIAAHVRPHDMRHAHLGTTETYLGRPRLDDMVTAVKNATYGIRTNVLGVADTLQIGLEATTGIEPV